MESEDWYRFFGIVLSVLFGTSLIFTAIIILLLQKDPIVNNELFFALRLLLALGAGFVSSGITGNLNLEIPKGKEIKTALAYADSISKVVIKAGGPIAVTVLVWIYSPEVLQVVETIST